MKRHLFILNISLGILLSTQVNCEIGEDWSQLGSDNCHSFFSNTFIANNLEILHQYPLRLEREAHFCELFSPAVVKNRIYISGLNHLHCLDLLTGELLYEVPAFSMYPFTPTIVDDKIYFATERNLFSCLDASTGETLWERGLSNLYEVSPLYDVDSIYITIDHFYSFTPLDLLICEQRVPQWATLLALDKKTGEEIWRYSIDDSSNPVIKCIGFPILVDGSILFGMSYQSKDEYGFTLEGKTSLVCLDARTGTFQWECENIFPFSPLDVVSLPFSLTYYKNNIYIGTNGQVICLELNTQAITWKCDLPTGWTLLSVGEDTVVARIFNWVYALEAESGEVRWKVLIDGISMHAMTESDVFIGSDDGNLYRIHIESGHIVESYYLGGFLYSTVVAHGCVVVGTSEEKIYCLGSSFSSNKLLYITIGLALFIFILMYFKHKYN